MAVSKTVMSKCRYLGLTSASTIHKASIRKENQFYFEDICLSLGDIQQYIGNIIVSDMSMNTWWITCDEIQIPVAYGDMTYWDNPEYGWHTDHIPPRKFLFQLEYNFQIENNNIKFEHEFCSQPYDRMEMGFDYGYWHQNDFSLKCDNKSNANLSKIKKSDFNRLLLSMLCLGYDTINKCQFVHEYISWIHDYTPYDEENDDPFDENIKLFQRLHVNNICNNLWNEKECMDTDGILFKVSQTVESIIPY